MSASVKCRQCEASNPDGAAFCMSCGSALARACPSCGAAALEGARFCSSCGTPLDGSASVPSGSVEADEERRTVTVLFADLSGYTSIAERLDHETVKVLIDRCLTRLAVEVERYDGRVDKFIGDNVMAVFGAPVAHENDPDRAVRAAFGMQAAMSELNRDLLPEFGLELALRVGVNTGEVLAGRIGEAYTVVGDAVNVAARLQAAASVGAILVGERTQRLSARTVVYREIAPLTLKGKAEPVPAWEAIELGHAEGATSERAPSTPLIGRDEELSRIAGAFARVSREGAPHLITVIGQAGVGKSRLLNECEARLGDAAGDVRIRRGRCMAFGASAVYWPLAEMLRGECDIGQGDDGELVASKLTDRLGPALITLEGTEHLERRIAPLARMLGAGGHVAAELATEAEDQQSARESLFGAARAVFEALAAEHTLVLAWEDIHWADDGTLELIEYLSRWLRAPVLQLCLAREELLERRPDWSTLRRTVTSMYLEPLAPAEARELIDALLAAEGAEAGLADALAERSGGNPLFAEAMVRRIGEVGGGVAEELPDTVQGLLAARLDALEPFERQLVTHAAVLGRTFWESGLEPVAKAAGEPLAGALAQLREKDILVPGDGAGMPGERELAFKHVLIRDVAYEMLPRAARARKHAEVAAFIESRSGTRSEATVALVADHYAHAASLAAAAHLPADELAELRARALHYGEAAGDAAAALYSNREALAQYEAAGRLAGDDQLSAHRIAEKRGDVSLRLGQVEPAIESWEDCLSYFAERGDHEHVAELHRKVGAALAHKGERKRAIEHHQQGINLIKDSPPSLTLVRLYEEAAWLYMQVGDNMLAIYASEKALRLAESLGEPRAASRAHGIFGRVFGRIGDGVKARENLERAVELARESDEAETVLGLLALGHNLEHAEGDHASAGDSYREALELAERIGDVPTQIELHSALAQLAFHRCDWPEVEQATNAGGELAEREGLVGKLCLTNALRGGLGWRDGDWASSIRLYSTANDLAEQVGWSEVAYGALIGLARTLRDQGELSASESTLEQALAVCERAGLVPQSVQVYAALALTRSLAGAADAARAAAAQAREISERIHDPAGEAAAREADGCTAELPGALEALAAAGESWRRLGRPLDEARCELLAGLRLAAARDARSEEFFARAAQHYEALGVPHLAALASTQAAGIEG
jgi:adenylate cyclase